MLLGAGAILLFMMMLMSVLIPVSSSAGATPASDIPPIAWQAYTQASDRLNQERPSCQMRPTVIAGIYSVESKHGQGKLDANGTANPPIQGPPTAYGTAKGPGQFIDSTWATQGRDGNGDGVADPQNIFDAALSTAGYLCESVQDGPMADRAVLSRALWSYNHAQWYVDKVLAEIDRYDHSPDPAAASGPAVETGGVGPNGKFVDSGRWPPPVRGTESANTREAANFARQRWGLTVGTYRSSGSVAGSDHPFGKAADIMTQDVALGDEIANWFISNPETFGTKYVIWNRRYTDGSGWRPYSGPSPHTDHVHVSFF